MAFRRYINNTKRLHNYHFSRRVTFTKVFNEIKPVRIQEHLLFCDPVLINKNKNKNEPQHINEQPVDKYVYELILMKKFQ